MGFLKLGQYVQLVPRPVTSGFMSGIGLIILTCQLLALLGSPPAASAVVRPRSHPVARGHATKRLWYHSLSAHQP